MSTGDDLSAKPTASETAVPGQENGPAKEDGAPPPDGQAAQPTVQHSAISGAMWIGIGFGATYLLRLVSSIILTRLVVPEVYALMDLAMVFLQGLAMFSDVGIHTSVVQSKRGDDPDFCNTAWTLQVLRGLVLWLATVLIAWPVALFYDKPVIVILMPVIGAKAILDGFCSTALFTLQRHLLRGRLVALEVGCAVLGLSVTLVWAWVLFLEQRHQAVASTVELIGSSLGQGPLAILAAAALFSERAAAPEKAVWALVAGSLVASLLNLCLSHFVLRGHRNRFRWDKTTVHELLHFGKWIFLSTIITFLAFQAERLIVPKVSGFEVMGVYGRAVSLAAIATGLMSAFCCQLVFPIYSRMHQEGRDIRLSFVKVQTRVAGFAALLVTGMLAAGTAGVRCLYGPLYYEAGWMLLFVAIGAWFQMLEGTIGASLLALGRPSALMLGNGSRLLGVLVFVPSGYWLGDQAKLGGPENGGLIGMLLGFIAADFSRYLVVIWVARVNGMSAVRVDVALSVLILAISPVAAFAGGYLAALCNAFVSNSKVQDFVLLFFQGGLVVLIWGLLFLLWVRKRRGRGAPEPSGGETPSSPEPGAAPRAEGEAASEGDRPAMGNAS